MQPMREYSQGELCTNLKISRGPDENTQESHTLQLVRSNTNLKVTVMVSRAFSDTAKHLKQLNWTLQGRSNIALILENVDQFPIAVMKFSLS